MSRRTRDAVSGTSDGTQTTAPASRLSSPARLPTMAVVAGAVAHPARRASAIATLPAAQPAPVQVSIGRIEIRATPAQTPTRPPGPSRTPALTLDDYLRRRHGEGR